MKVIFGRCEGVTARQIDADISDDAETLIQSVGRYRIVESLKGFLRDRVTDGERES